MTKNKTHEREEMLRKDRKLRIFMNLAKAFIFVAVGAVIAYRLLEHIYK